MATSMTLTPLHVPTEVLVFNDMTDFDYGQIFKPTWSNEDSYGKMDGIPFYGRTKREIGVTFILDAKGSSTVPSVAKAREINAQVDLLVRLQYPKYKSIGNSSQRTFAGAPFFRMSLTQVYSLGSGAGSYPLTPELTGYITGLQITPGSKSGFNTVLDTGANPKRALQTRYEVSFEFIIMHQTLPGWQEGGVFTTAGDGFYYSYYSASRAKYEDFKDTLAAAFGSAANAGSRGVQAVTSAASTFQSSLKQANPDASLAEVKAAAAQAGATKPKARGRGIETIEKTVKETATSGKAEP